MKTRNTFGELSGKYRGKVFILSLIMLVTMTSTSQAATMGDYCQWPPLIGANIKPNLLLMIDNSASMYDLAHISSSGTYCYDNSYDDLKSYEGYFDQDLYYRYLFGFFSAVATLPTTEGANIYRTSYLWIQMRTESNGTRDVYEFQASGRFLNWLSASKFDIQKKFLTGGKYQQYTNTTYSNTRKSLIGESRGCVGRRFVKEVPAAHWLYPAPPTVVPISFAVRGPSATEPDLINPNSQGGHTRIEIFEHNFDQASCINAANNWISGSYGQAQTETKDCLDVSETTPGTSSGRSLAAFTHSLQTCWLIKDNYARGRDVWQGINIQDVKTACRLIYERDGKTPATITDESSPYYMCTGAKTGHSNPAPAPYNSMGDDDTGFIGKYWNGTAFPNDATTDDGIKREMLHYCAGVSYPEVVDPSSGALDTLQSGNIPAILMDAGIRAGGDPIRPWECYDEYPSGTQEQIKSCNFFEAKPEVAAAPTGLIDDFKSHIRFGIMAFNDIGSASPLESTLPGYRTCSATTSKICTANSDCPGTETCNVNRDGGRIVHYIGQGKCSVSTDMICVRDSNCPTNEKCIDTDSAGSHTTAKSLIKAVDDLRGTAWTPFAEAYYNAMGYFAPIKKTCSKTTTQTCAGDDQCPIDATTGKRERCETFGRTDLRLSGLADRSDFDERLHPSNFDCQKNFMLIVTDGMSTADRNDYVYNLANAYKTTLTNAGGRGPDVGYTSAASVPPPVECPTYKGSVNLDNLAWIAKNRKLSDFSQSSAGAYRSESIRTFTVYNGTACNAADGSCAGECNPITILDNTAINGSMPSPTGVKIASDPASLKDALRNVFTEIAAETVSGTAASVLASGEGSGANLIQAIFYPSKKFDTYQVQWSGRLSNYWYYVDPFFANSNMREESSTTDRVLNLKTDAVNKDYIFQFFFNDTLATPAVQGYRWQDADGDGSLLGESLMANANYEDLGTLWEAGTLLWKNKTQIETESSSAYRKILTPNLSATATANNLMTFTTGYAGTLQSYLNAANVVESHTIIRYVRGEDFDGTVEYRSGSTRFTPNYRSRKAKIGTETYIWKLGDILNSTPKISSWMPLNRYHITYNDTTYGPLGRDASLREAVDTSKYTTKAKYKGRGMVFAGANDGMMHAFRLGTLELDWSGQDKTFEKARMTNKVCSGNANIGCISDAQCAAAAPSAGTCTTTVTLGDEVWAFIPKNVLPYLKYMAEGNYCHVYSVDLTPYMLDASIGPTAGTDESTTARTADSWKTILIGGMRLGGACRKPGETCTDGNCVRTPTTDPGNPNKGLGYSSYFALDITDQNDPKFLWEYDGTVISGATVTNKLGFSTTGPAIVRINAKNPSTLQSDQNLNGKWFVVFGSGPTGNIDTEYKQFKGNSDQNLTLHIVPLKTGPGTNNANVRILDTTIPEAFAGSMANASHDPDLDYQDDVVYVPYVKKASDGTWTQGGVGRLLTNEDPNPANWEWADVITNAGPVTSAVARLMNTRTKTMWLFFGSGRYFYETAGSTDDPNPARRRQLFGMKDPCTYADAAARTGIGGFLSANVCKTKTLSFDCSDPYTATTCPDNVPGDGLINVDDVDDASAINSSDTAFKGWYINLDAKGDYGTKSYHGEREITDPLSTSSGVVFFTTYRPYDDPCALGGKTFIWAVKYDSGDAAGTLLQGKAMVQVSTGTIEQVDLSTAFKERIHGDGAPSDPNASTDPNSADYQKGRRTQGLEGVPPVAQGLSVVSTASPVKRIMHIKER